MQRSGMTSPLLMGYVFKNLITKTFAEVNYTPPVAARAEASAFTGEGEQVFGVAVSTLNTGKTKMRVTAIEVFIYNIDNVRTPVTVHMLIDGIPDTLWFLVIIFYRLVVFGVAW